MAGARHRGTGVGQPVIWLDQCGGHFALVTLRKGTACRWRVADVLWALLPAGDHRSLMTGDTGSSAMLLLGAYGSGGGPPGERQPLIWRVLASVPLATGRRLCAHNLLNGPFLEDLVATFNQALAQLERDLQPEAVRGRAGVQLAGGLLRLRRCWRPVMRSSR